MTTMRIAYVCSDPGVPIFGNAGSSVHAQAVLQVLSAKGHDIHLITPRPGGEPHVPLTMHQLPAISGRPTAARELSARASDAMAVLSLTAVSPDLVYERYSLWGITATRWAADHGIPSVLEVNAPLVEEQAIYRELADRAAAEEVARAALSLATVVVCVSDEVANWARSISARPERVGTLPNGVDTDRIRPAVRPVAPSEGSDFTVGFVGTLKAWHGVGDLVVAMASVIDSETKRGADPTWRLLVVGDGPEGRSISQLVDECGIASQVELTGAVASADVATQLQRMDVACAPYPAQDRFYFSPLKIYEYLAAGLPIVASAVGQVPDALEHGRLGRLVAPGDVQGLADELRACRADHDGRRKLRTLTRQAALRRHTWTAVVESALGLADLNVAV
jgi:glycosyltransferase involved in cell wall biosynthesis